MQTKTKTKAIFNWSGGKDSSLCLRRVLAADEYDIRCLLTTYNERHQRDSMHGVRLELLDMQADRLGLPLIKVPVPEDVTLKSYDRLMKETLDRYGSVGLDTSIFGDIFLEDLRQYREDRLAEAGFNGVFPLWKNSTSELAQEFIDLGFKALVACVDDRKLDESFVGREYDAAFLSDLPDGVDPCGEYGEFHTFVYDGPIFKSPIAVKTGENVYRPTKLQASVAADGTKTYTCPSVKEDGAETGGFWFCDLLPA